MTEGEIMDGLVFISHSSADKPIADAICHHLEAQGLRCWIAPRDIKSTDWAGSIMDGLHKSQVFVIIVSHNSINSGEVTKEVTEATRCCDYLVPFKVDQEELSDRLRYHLGPCHWLDAVTPPLEKRIEELTQRILHLSEEDAVYLNSGRYSLVERMAYPRPNFIGREAEIEEISEVLSDERVVFLQGMGGIGKSEIAKGYAAANRDKYDTVIFASYSSDLTDLVCSDSLPIANLHRAEKEGNESFFRRKLDVFQTLADERTLLIIDNFDVDTDEKMDDLLSMPCKFIFTTRNDHSDYPTVSVGPLKDIELQRKLFEASFGKPLKPADVPVVDEMLQLVNGHTITIELIARQMKASFKTPQKMLEILKDTGVDTKLKEKIKREGTDAKLSAFDYIRNLFSVAGLDDDARQFMRMASLLPVSGIEVPLLGEMLEMDDLDIVNDLAGKNWLLLRGDGDVLQMHPVIADVVRAELKPDQENCRDYIKALGEKARYFWGMDPDIRDVFYSLVLRLQTLFPVPTRELFAEYGWFANAGWICGDYERSQQVSRRYYEYALQEFGAGSLEAGLGATYTAGAYYNSGDWKSAGPWYELSFKHQLINVGLADETADIDDVLKTAPDPAKLDALDGNTLEQLYAVCTRIGRTNTFEGRFDKAEQALDLCMRYADIRISKGNFPFGRKHPGWYGGILQERERLYLAEEKWQESYEQAKSTCELLNDDIEREEANLPFSLINMGRALSHLGRFDEAEASLNQAKEIIYRLLGEHSRSAFTVRDAIADKLILENHVDEGLSMLRLLELDLEKYMGENNPETIRIREKLERISADQMNP